ncbi:MAG: GNAT family N-acetyltransferase [Saccharospirillum sp.]|nr:GNAT family N-acetyltransferase [Saccharospirillum sp.]
MTQILYTERLALKPPQAVTVAQLHAYHKLNRQHFIQGGGILPVSAWDCRRRLSFERKQWRQGSAYRFYGFLGKNLVLDIGLSNVIRGLFYAAHLGYRTDKAHQGQGLMSEAARAVVDFAFHEVCLHRIMANYQPDNLASGRVLEKLGFKQEGFAPDYLLIGGQWRDHILTALTYPHWQKPSAPP